MQTVNQARTLVKFGVQKTNYVSGQGVTTDYEIIKVKIGEDEDGKDIETSCFYVEWLNAYGSVAIQQQAEGVLRPARVRMKYVKAVYDALIGDKPVIVYLRGIVDDAHAFILASAADNYLNENQMIEFAVKKREVR